MRTLTLGWGAPALLALILLGCKNDGPPNGDPCTPVIVPCDFQGQNCGYNAREFSVEKSDQCGGQYCAVDHLDNGTSGAIASDPRVVCSDGGSPPGCVTPAATEASIYCTCRCRRLDGKVEDTCRCGDGFACAAFDGLQDSYCQKIEAHSPGENDASISTR